MDCSLPGFFVHGILQARILEWVVISFSRGSSWPRDRTQVLRITGRLYHLSYQGIPVTEIISCLCCRASKEVSVIQDVLQFTNGSWEDILITLWFTLQVLQIQLKCVLSSHLGDLTQNQWQPWAYLLPSWWWVLHCLAQKHPEGCRDRGGVGACVRLKLVRKQNLVHLLIFSPRKLYRLVLHVPGRRNRILWSTPLLTVSLTYI